MKKVAKALNLSELLVAKHVQEIEDTLLTPAQFGRREVKNTMDAIRRRKLLSELHNNVLKTIKANDAKLQQMAA